tara:strand:- start:1837 stop:4668 length:2832 start_codon:yes stop_codon:yes gene_type:complete
MASTGRLGTHDITINTIGGTALGFMLANRGFVVRDAQTIGARILTTDQLTHAQLPPDVELIEFQENWIGGMGGRISRLHPKRLASANKLDMSVDGKIVLARETQESTVDSVPNEYVPSGFVVTGSQAWAFIGRDLYSWDFTNKNWDIQTEPLAATRLYRNGVAFGAYVYAPAWADDAGSGGSYTADDEPISYIYKTPAAAQWSLISTDAKSLDGCKYMAVADSKLWGGYWAAAADSALDVDGPIFDAGGAGGADDLLSTKTLSHTVATGANRLLVVGVTSHTPAGAPSRPTGVTYDSVAMTEITAARGNSTDVTVTLWYLIAPNVGTANIVATFGAGQRAQVTAVSLSGVDQSTPVENGNSATGTSTAPSVAVTTAVRDWVVDCVGFEDPTADSAAAGTGQTERGETHDAPHGAATSTEEATGASTTMSWTLDSSVEWAIGAVAINPATVQTSNTIIPVTGTPSSQFTAGDVVRIETELMLVTTVSDSPPTITVVRAYRGSVAATHAAATDIYEITENVHHVKSGAVSLIDLANWSTSTPIGDSSSPITALVGVDTVLIVCKTDGVYKLEPDGTVTELRPELKAITHPDNFRGAFAWQDKVLLPLGTGGMLELETTNWTISSTDIIKDAMPDRTEFHGRVVAGHGEPTRLYIQVDEAANTRYHILMGEYSIADGVLDYHWSHLAVVSYTTGTDVDHAAVLVEGVSSGANVHHRVNFGIESTGSSLLPMYLPLIDDDEATFTPDDDSEAVTTKIDFGLPKVSKRLQDLTLETNNHGAGGTDHFSEWQYRVDGGAWTYITGVQGTSKVTTSPQTLTFPAGITGKVIEIKYLPSQGTTTTTGPELVNFTLTCQLRPTAIKTVGLRLTLSDGLMLRNGVRENNMDTLRDQLRTWDAQAAEVVLVDIEEQTRNCVFLPGFMTETPIAIGSQNRRPAHAIDLLLAEVGS